MFSSCYETALSLRHTRLMWGAVGSGLSVNSVTEGTQAAPPPPPPQAPPPAPVPLSPPPVPIPASKGSSVGAIAGGIAGGVIALLLAGEALHGTPTSARSDMHTNRKHVCLYASSS